MGGVIKGRLFMSQYVNVSNSWRNTKYVYVNVSGSWKSCNNIYVNNNGTWRPLHAYWWNIGGWGGCSASCGGGWQYRTVNCYRSHSSNHSLDQLAMDDSYCIRNVGTKPTTQQQCNTHSCADCRYQLNVSYWESRETQLITAFPAFVMWEGNLAAAIATNDNANWNITQLSANGYLYTRSTYQGTGPACTSVIGGVGPCTTRYYTACRQPA